MLFWCGRGIIVVWFCAALAAFAGLPAGGSCGCSSFLRSGPCRCSPLRLARVGLGWPGARPGRAACAGGRVARRAALRCGRVACRRAGCVCAPVSSRAVRLVSLRRLRFALCVLAVGAWRGAGCGWFRRGARPGRGCAGGGVAVVVGFSGSRFAGACSSLAVSVAGALPASASVWAGCAPGVDAAALGVAARRGLVSRRFVASSSRPSALVARSVSFVRALAGCPRSVLLVFPSGPCPAGVRPSSSASACFCGSGSGSWASAALAVGSGVAVLVFGPCPPAAWSPRAVRAFGLPAFLCRPASAPLRLF